MGLIKLNINTLYFIFIKYCAFQSYTQAKKITLLTGNCSTDMPHYSSYKGGLLSFKRKTGYNGDSYKFELTAHLSAFIGNYSYILAFY
ncbi:hypothetical protein DLE54_08900 [Psychrobacter sp. YP14]|nr:hypothetical protein DLE54_08900 [Psychrobacter sp. YP14]